MEPAELNAANLEGAKVYDRNEEEVGNISHLYGHRPDTYAIIDVGGFLGIGAKPVALRLSTLDVMRGNGSVDGVDACEQGHLK